MSLDVDFEGDDKEYLSEENISEENMLSFNILQGLCDVIQENVETDSHHIHLELNQDRLLLR